MIKIYESNDDGTTTASRQQSGEAAAAAIKLDDVIHCCLLSEVYLRRPSVDLSRWVDRSRDEPKLWRVGVKSRTSGQNSFASAAPSECTANDRGRPLTFITNLLLLYMIVLVLLLSYSSFLHSTAALLFFFVLCLQCCAIYIFIVSPFIESRSPTYLK